MKIRKLTRRDKRGAALVEYGLIVAGVALVAVAAVSIFGFKTAGMIGTSAALLPGAQADDVGVISTGKIVKTQNNGGIISVADDAEQNSLGDNLGFDTEDLIDDPASN